MAAALAFAYAAAPSLTRADQAIEFVLSGGKLTEGPSRVQVSQGERVELVWRSDTPVEVHLHGYDKLVYAARGKPGRMTIECNATGRFPISLHGTGGNGLGHKPLAYFEVHPR